MWVVLFLVKSSMMLKIMIIVMKSNTYEGVAQAEQRL